MSLEPVDGHIEYLGLWYPSSLTINPTYHPTRKSRLRAVINSYVEGAVFAPPEVLAVVIEGHRYTPSDWS